jgi:hypothetical protein
MIRVSVFSNDLMPRGLGSVYIALSVQHEPLDQTDLNNSVDAILGGGGGTFWKLLIDGAHTRPGGQGGGIAYLTLTCRSSLMVF